MDVIKTGTTTLGIVCKDGVVLAADKRVTLGGGMIIDSEIKIVKLNDRFAVTIAGVASDAELLSRHIKAELKLKELRSHNHVTAREAANLLAQFVYQNVRTPSTIPGITHFLFGGRDHTGVYLYDIFADGHISHVQKYFSSGSGSVHAFAVLDADYKEDITVNEGIKLAKKAIRSAMMRDNASGNGYDIVTITKDKMKDVESVLFNPQIAQ